MFTMYPLVILLICMWAFSSEKNMLWLMIYIEIMMLVIIMMFVLLNISTNNENGQIIFFYMLTLAAVETAMGLSLMCSFYSVVGTITMKKFNLLKG